MQVNTRKEQSELKGESKGAVNTFPNRTLKSVLRHRPGRH